MHESARLPRPSCKCSSGRTKGECGKLKERAIVPGMPHVCERWRHRLGFALTDGGVRTIGSPRGGPRRSARSSSMFGIRASRLARDDTLGERESRRAGATSSGLDVGQPALCAALFRGIMINRCIIAVAITSLECRRAITLLPPLLRCESQSALNEQYYAFTRQNRRRVLSSANLYNYFFVHLTTMGMSSLQNISLFHKYFCYGLTREVLIYLYIYLLTCRLRVYDPEINNHNNS